MMAWKMAQKTVLMKAQMMVIHSVVSSARKKVDLKAQRIDG